MAGWTANKDEHGRALVECRECAKTGVAARFYHQLSNHLKRSHDLDASGYTTRFPGALILSPTMSAHLKKQSDKLNGTEPVPVPTAEAGGEAAKGATKAKLQRLRFGVSELYIREGLGEEDTALVPAHDDDYELDDSVLELLALGIQQGDNTLLVGPTGAGKTALVRELAALLNQPVRRLNLHGDVRAADFVGEKVVDVDMVSGEAVVRWKDGILPDAMEKGHWLLLDELDGCPPAIAFVLQAVLESELDKQLVLSGDHGRVVKAHPLFRIIGTANTLGRGDDTGLYTGTQVMNEAFLDRFGTVITFSYLDPATEAGVLVKKSGVGQKVAEDMVKVANLVRGGLEKEECFCTFSTRRLLKWSSKAVALGGTPTAIWRALDIAVLNKLNKDDNKYVSAIVQRAIGSRPSLAAAKRSA